MTRGHGLVMSRMFLTVALAMLGGCAADSGAGGWIRQYGAMRQVMREGQTRPRFALAEAAHAGMYGVGAMAGLLGEVTIDDGRVWVTRAASDGLRTSGLFPGGAAASDPLAADADRATLLTLARVTRWQERTISPGEGELGGGALEEAIRGLAVAHGVGGRGAAERPFVFTIDSKSASLELHVIDGSCPSADAEARAVHLVVAPGERVRIIGIFAPGREGELTHHGTALHAHAILTRDGGTITAHADTLRVGAGSVLRVGE